MFDRKVCIGCGASILKNATFCPLCGCKQARPMSEGEVNKDPFKILQVSPNAEDEVINAAYRGLARKYHPDSAQSKQDSERIKDINWAYSVLKDPIKRRQWEESQTASYRQTRERPYSSTQDYSSKPRSQSTSQTQAKTKPQPKTTYVEVTSRGKRPSLLVIIIVLGVIGSGISYINSTTNQPQNSGVITSTECKYSEVMDWLNSGSETYNQSNSDWNTWNENFSPSVADELWNKANGRKMFAQVRNTPSCLKTLQEIDILYYSTRGGREKLDSAISEKLL